MVKTYPENFEAKDKIYDTAILDLGSVLIDFNPEKAAVLLGNDLQRLPLELCRKMSLSRPFMRCALGIVSVDQAISELYDLYPKAYVDLFKKHPLVKAFEPLKPGLRLFHYLREHAAKLYLLSNITPLIFEHVQATTPFVRQADGYMVSYEAKSRKPDTIIYTKLLDKYTINPSSALFIDDLAPNCKVGASLGIDSIVCDYNENLIEFVKKLTFSKQQ